MAEINVKLDKGENVVEVHAKRESPVIRVEVIGSGPQGKPGADGYSPTITTEEITGGHRLTIIDKDHPAGQTVDVMDGQNGQDGADGAPGQDGADGAPGVGVPTGGTTGQVLAKASSTDYDTEWVNAGGGTPEIFWATYGTTTSAELEAAYQAGKLVCVSPYNELMYVLCRRSSSTDHGFMSVATETSVRWARCYNDTWSNYAGTIPSAATATPSDLGTAAKGTSTKYAREDHVHKKPTASDLGITVPSAYTSAPADLGTASAGSSTKYAKGDHVHNKPTYSKSDVGLGNVDNIQQYSANNPPPYPVSSVNGQTGAVSLSIPSAAADVGAVASNQGSGNAGKFLSIANDDTVTPADLPVYNGGVS